MNKAKPRSIVLKNGPQAREYRTFEDWQAEQGRDERSPEERGIKVGSSVMWRHRHNGIIVTERATVSSITDSTLTLEVKDVKTRTCSAHIREIVNTADEHPSPRDAYRRSYPNNNDAAKPAA
jgi:hypothetical protein